MINIGITGHRNLNTANNYKYIEETITILKVIIKAHPNNSLMIYSGLADGGIG